MTLLSNQDAVERHLIEATQEVLETMFFASFESELEDEPTGGEIPSHRVGASVRFHGAAEGELRIALSEDMAGRCAHDFFGNDSEEATNQISLQIVQEMTNMICGNWLSKLEKQSIFCLDSPIPVNLDDQEWKTQQPEWVARKLLFDSGLVEVQFHTGFLAEAVS